MVLLESLVLALTSRAREEAKVRENGSFRTASLFFDPVAWDDLVGMVREVIAEVESGGEWISWSAENGTIRDGGEEAFSLVAGSLHEFYDYESSTVSFVRLLHVRSPRDDDWFALYVDENPETPWWSKEERA